MARYTYLYANIAAIATHDYAKMIAMSRMNLNSRIMHATLSHYD